LEEVLCTRYLHFDSGLWKFIMEVVRIRE
jgi:hypothetical protein